MARQKTTTLEDLIMAVSKLPWWAGILLAVVSYVVLHAFVSRPVMTITAPGQLGNAAAKGIMTGFAMIGQYVLPFAFGVGAIVSAINSTRQKKKKSEPLVINNKSRQAVIDPVLLRESNKSEMPCPKCGGKLVRRVAKRGSNEGKSFLGCSNYPRCKYTMAT